MSVDNMRSIVLLLCTCIANFRFYKPSFPYCARLCWIKKWQQQQPESHNNFGIEEFSAASLKSYSTRPKSLPLLGVSVSCQLSPFPSQYSASAFPEQLGHQTPAQCFHAKLDSYVGAAPAKDQRTPCIHD